MVIQNIENSNHILTHNSKHAVLGRSRNDAVELGHFGIRVNFLAPFTLATPLATKFVGRDSEELEKAMYSIANLKGVTLKAEDVANAALFLATEEAKYISGHSLFVDGGFNIYNSDFRMFLYPES